MKKFKYRMQGILELKRKLEEQEKTNYSIAQAKLRAEQEKLESLQRRKELYEERLRQKVGKKLVLLEIRQNQDAIETLKQFIRQQGIVVKKAEQNVEVALHLLQQAIMERKSQEKLREKAFEQYKMEFEAEERKEVDEIVSYQYGTR